MINIEKINELAMNLPMNSRLPQNPIIHRLAYDDHALKFLSYGMEYHSHITFLVIQPEEVEILKKGCLQSVHCIVIKGVGVVLSTRCSNVSEQILVHFAGWAPYLKLQDELQYYIKYN
jgi:hypothetical protein